MKSWVNNAPEKYPLPSCIFPGDGQFHREGAGGGITDKPTPPPAPPQASINITDHAKYRGGENILLIPYSPGISSRAKFGSPLRGY